MKYFPAALLVMSFFVTLKAQPITVDVRQSPDVSALRYHYIFENERFTTTHIELDFDGSGAGEYRFKKKGYDELVNKLQVSKRVLSQLNSALTELNFLESSENYQHKKDYSHLGTITIAVTRGERNRSITFTYSENQALNRLTSTFRNLATQESRYFEIESVRQSDPLSTPAQLRYLEAEIKSQNIADPERFIPLLSEIKVDEGVPLIARNHAERLLKDIGKMK